ncbi:MAG: hypothetical protein ACOX9C_07200 [Kiritimatiellia bacterium]|jgi:hypothetical protein
MDTDFLKPLQTASLATHAQNAAIQSPRNVALPSPIVPSSL